MHRTVKAAAVGALLALAIAVQAVPAGSMAIASQGAGTARMCQVNDDGVRYRSGPGIKFPALGTVNRGQKYDVYGHENGWANGTVIGVIGNVWIQESFLSC